VTGVQTCALPICFRRQVQRVLDNYRQPALVEPYIDGREFNVSVMENTAVVPLPVSEIDFSAMPKGSPKICSYEAKWFEDHPLYQKTPPVCPAPIDDELRQKLQGAAADAFRTMGCRDYARVDFRMDGKGRIFILEVNPNPDISLNAGYARALKAAGIEYEAFWDTMVRNALKRKESNDPTHAAAR
jgi:D-alanine-D-alanine ligase